MTPEPPLASISVIIPARNEVALIGATVRSAFMACAEFQATVGPAAVAEVIVVDNASTDGTAEVLAGLALAGVRVVPCDALGAARARNVGARAARGSVLVLLDADTRLPPGALRRFAALCGPAGFEAGIVRLGALDGGWRARAWWAFWNAVRRLPLARAKAMPACMFCTRAAFAEFGPFDVRVAIGEEWPILAGLYRARPSRLIYDQSTSAPSSGRRMELQPFGYTRTLLRLCRRDPLLSRPGPLLRPRPPPPVGRAGRRPPRAGRPSRPLVTAPRRASRLGPALNQVRLNAIERRVGPDGAWLIAKRRFRYAPALIAPGNLYLRWLGAGVVVLGDRAWKGRERAVNRRLYVVEAVVDARGWLLLPEWPGGVAERYVADRSHPPRDRLAAFAAGARALGALHQVEVDWPGEPGPTLSHGDAQLRNAVYDPAAGDCRWFDFDTAHRPDMAPLARRADDLRALLYSALGAADLPVPDVFETIRSAYRDEAAWDRLRADLRRGPVHFSPFHFARAAPSVARRAELERLIWAH